MAVTSTADAGVTRSFTSLTAVADEAALSRIWSGQHTRIDDQAGRQLGRQVAGAVLGALQVTPRRVSRTSHDRVAARGVGDAVACVTRSPMKG